MKLTASAFLSRFARVSSDPLLIRSDRAHLPAAIMSRALRADMVDGADDEPDGDECMPWEERERIQILPGGLAVVPFRGMVCAGVDDFTAWAYDLARPEFLQEACTLLAARPDVSVVLFDIDSPGGYTTAVPETAELISRLTAAKTTVAFTSGMMCSAAYWLGAQCSRIVVTPSSTVGSVGTYATIYDFSKMFEDAGVTAHVLKAGTLKAIGVPGAPVTDEQLAFIQGNVDRINAGFLAAVARGRGALAEADLQGQWFDGDLAVEKRLADATALNRAEFLSAWAAQFVQIATA